MGPDRLAIGNRQPGNGRRLSRVRALAVLTLAGIGVASTLDGDSQTPSHPTPRNTATAAAESTLARADAYWDAERFDLAAAEYRAYWAAHPAPSDARDRAGVLAARALLELGEKDKAREQLVAVADDEMLGLWGCRALCDLARLAPTLYLSPRTRADTLRVEREVAAAEARLERAIRYLRAGSGDSAWTSTRAQCERDFMSRSDTADELDARFVDALTDSEGDEAEATLRMTYAGRLQAIPLPDRFLPQLRRLDQARVRDHIERDLRVVVDSLGETSSAPKAALMLVHTWGPESEEWARYLQLLLDRYPNSPEAEQAASLRQRQATLHATVLQTIWPTGDSIHVYFRVSGPGRLAPTKVTLFRLDRKQALSFHASEIGRPKGRHRGTRVETLTFKDLSPQHPDTTVSFELAPGFYTGLLDGAPRAAPVFSFQVAGHRSLPMADRDSLHVLVVTSRAIPVASAAVDLYEKVEVEDPRRRYSTRLLERGTRRTDLRGEVHIPLPKRGDPPFAGSAVRRFVAVSRTVDEFMVQPFDVEDVDPVHTVVWTDRTIYRPGDEVHFSAIFLLGPTYGMAPAPGESLQVVASFQTGNRGSAQAETTLVTDRFGAAAGVFRVPEDAGDGPCHISASTHHWGGLGSSTGASPSIRSFVRPDFDLTIDLGREELAVGDGVEAVVNARTAQGVPLSGARVTCSVDRVRMSRRYDRQGESVAQGWYGPPDGETVIDYGNRSHDERIVEKRIVLDSKGRAVLRLPARRRGPMSVTTTPRMITGLLFRATLDDKAGRYRTAEVTLPVFPGRAWCDGPASEGSNYYSFPVAVRRLGNDNRPAPGRIFYRWVRLKADLEHDRYLESVVHSDSIMTDANAVAHIEPPPAYSPDQALDVWADAETGEATRIGWPTYPDEATADALQAENGGWNRRDTWIAPDRLQYSIGDTAKVSLSAEIRSRPGFLDLSGGRMGRRRVWTLPAGTDSVVAVPIGSEHLPEAVATWHPIFWESAIGIRQRRGSAFFEPLPVARERIVVEPSSRSLSIEVLPARTDYAPGDTIAIEVRVADAAGTPVAARLTLGAIDESVYALEPDRLDILRRLYQLAWLGDESTAMALTAGSAPPAIPPARTAFRPTAFWLPEVMTDVRTGRAVVKAKLPDDLAQWRITARGIDRAGRIGEARATFTTERPLSIRPRLPRFARLGDRFAFDVLIDNHTNRKVDCVVAWSSEDLRPASRTTGRAQVLPGRSGSVQFAAQSTRAGESRIRMTVRAGALGDSVEHTVPVYEIGTESSLPPASPVRFSLADVLRQVREATFDSTWNPIGGRSCSENMRLLLALAQGWDLLAGDDRSSSAAGTRSEIPFAGPPSPGAQLIRELRYELFRERRQIVEEPPRHEQLHAAADRARLVSVVVEAGERGWKVDRKNDRKQIERWLERVVVDPGMDEDQRVEVAAGLVGLDERRTEGVRASAAAWRNLCSGARALLATCIEETEHEGAGAHGATSAASRSADGAIPGAGQTPDAAMLLASAAAFARWSPDSAFACYPRSDGRRREIFSPQRNSAEVLRAVSSRDAGHPLARALANGLVLQLAASEWHGSEDIEEVVAAIVDYAGALSAGGRRRDLNEIARADPGILRLQRTVTVVGTGVVTRGPSAADTVQCAVGDTLLVSLSPAGPLVLDWVEILDPTPAGATTVIRKETWPYHSLPRTVRDNYVQLSAYLHLDQPVFEHLLVADRSGSFHVPPAHLSLEHLPAIQSATRPLFLEIMPRR